MLRLAQILVPPAPVSFSGQKKKAAPIGYAAFEKAMRRFDQSAMSGVFLTGESAGADVLSALTSMRGGVGSCRCSAV